MNIEYYQQQDLKYVEVATALEKFHYASEGKFFINAITPLLNSNSPKNDKKSKLSTANILNYNSKLGISSFTLSNYISLKVPEYMIDKDVDKDGYYTNNEIIDKHGYIAKDMQFLVVFVGGDINKPRIMGVY